MTVIGHNQKTTQEHGNMQWDMVTGNIMLANYQGIALNTLPETVTLEEDDARKVGQLRFERSSELHISIGKMATILEAHGGIKPPEAWGVFRTAWNQHILTGGETTGPLLLTNKPNTDTYGLIYEVEVNNIEMFAAAVRRKLPGFVEPWTHTTLYTSGDPHGVAIRTAADAGQRTVPVSVPEVETPIFRTAAWAVITDRPPAKFESGWV